MKIWKEFGSSHSAHICIISEFKSAQEAENVKLLIEDFILAQWESRFNNLEEFLEKWKITDSNITYIGLTDREFQIGFDNSPDIYISNNEIIIKNYSDTNLGGLIKILIHKSAKRIEITEP